MEFLLACGEETGARGSGEGWGGGVTECAGRVPPRPPGVGPGGVGLASPPRPVASAGGRGGTCGPAKGRDDAPRREGRRGIYGAARTSARDLGRVCVGDTTSLVGRGDGGCSSLGPPRRCRPHVPPRDVSPRGRGAARLAGAARRPPPRVTSRTCLSHGAGPRWGGVQEGRKGRGRGRAMAGWMDGEWAGGRVVEGEKRKEGLVCGGGVRARGGAEPAPGAAPSAGRGTA
jgi:hypothetical protein